MSLRIGFVGLGNIGKPMALRLAGSPDVDLTVYDVVPEPVAELEKAGAKVASSVAGLAAEVDILCVMVRDDDQVREVLGEVLGVAGERLTVAIHSTIGPGTPGRPRGHRDPARGQARGRPRQRRGDGGSRRDPRDPGRRK